MVTTKLVWPSKFCSPLDPVVLVAVVVVVVKSFVVVLLPLPLQLGQQGLLWQIARFETRRKIKTLKNDFIAVSAQE